MATDPNSALDTLAGVIQSIARDRNLRQWFSALAKMSAIGRRNEIFAMTVRMKQEGEDGKIIASLHLLSDEKVFNAACESLGHLKE